jgi:hemin uptake protein HemP
MSFSGPLSVPRGGLAPDDMHRTAQPVHDARDLVPNGISAQIVLDGTVYVLRITRAGKLILTK